MPTDAVPVVSSRPTRRKSGTGLVDGARTDRAKLYGCHDGRLRSTERSDPTEAWYTLHTRARHEKAVRARLERRRILALLPSVTSSRRWNDRTGLVEEPLFPGYCFAKFRLRDRFTVLNIPGVVHVVGGAVPEHDLHAVKTLLRSEARVEPHPYLTGGIRVRVARGPLQGIEGILLEQRGSCRLVIGARLIHQAASVHLPSRDVEPIAPIGGPKCLGGIARAEVCRVGATAA